jgi:hypothetical protein
MNGLDDFFHGGVSDLGSSCEARPQFVALAHFDARVSSVLDLCNFLPVPLFGFAQIGATFKLSVTFDDFVAPRD